VDQLIDHLFLTKGEGAQDLTISKNALDLKREQALAREMASPLGLSKEHWHLIFDTIACGVVLINSEIQIVEANRAARQILGVSFEAMQQYLFGPEHNVFTRPDGTPLPYEEFQTATVFRTGQAQHHALEGFLRPDGQLCWLQIDAAPICEAVGTVTYAVITFVDVTERVEAEKNIKVSEARFRALTEQSNDFTAIIDVEGRFQFVSSSFRRILGYEPGKLIGTSMFGLIHPEDLQRILTMFMEGLQTNIPLVQTECRILRADESWLTVESVVYNCLNDPAIRGIVITSHDITERVAMEETLRYQTQYDSLTGMLNGSRFMEVLEQETLIAYSEQRSMAVLVLDIDRFKDVNDTLGHHHGDLILQQVGMRLQQIVQAPDMVSRLGSDEFAILLLRAGEAEAEAVATAIRRSLEEPCMIDGHPVQIDVSIGGSLHPAHASDAITLLRRANTSMYIVKQAHDGYALFQSAFEHFNPHRLTLIAELRQAIANGELRLYYQPKIDLKSRAICSVEALVRWQHPSRGLVPPDQFIPLAEQTGLIGPLSHWVLEEAARQCGEWLRTGYKLSIAINLSAWNLRDVTLPNTIAALLEQYCIPARLLCIELTESAVMTDTHRSLDILAHIFALGVHISIDDFGTGYSSLAYLKQLPIDELKIDRSFVQQMNTSKADATIVRSTINLAHSFGLRVVAEGVEDVATLELLSTFHCDIAQGYYMSRPLPVAQLERWLGERARNQGGDKPSPYPATMWPASPV
jgi:diguanylate cyclase (GGDEF)-like protein/PAS domain S-box-containing protein